MCEALQNYFDRSDQGEAAEDELRKTQEQLAETMNVRQPTVSRWASGRVPAERVRQLSQITGIPRASLRPDIYDSDARA